MTNVKLPIDKRPCHVWQLSFLLTGIVCVRSFPTEKTHRLWNIYKTRQITGESCTCSRIQAEKQRESDSDFAELINLTSTN